MVAAVFTARAMSSRPMIIDDPLRRTRSCRSPIDAVCEWDLAAAIRGEAAERQGWDAEFGCCIALNNLDRAAAVVGA
jgi:hypothetical protein